MIEYGNFGGIDIESYKCVRDSWRKVLCQSKSQLDLLKNGLDNREFGSILYAEVGRYHFAKALAESYLGNEIRLAPLMDDRLMRIIGNDKDPYLLYAVIMQRFCPKLLEFKIQGGRTIPESTIRKANDINAKYPKKEIEANEFNIVTGHVSLEFEINSTEEIFPNKWCMEAFSSDIVKGLIQKTMPAGTWNYAKRFAENNMWGAMTMIYTELGIALSVAACDGGIKDGFDFLNSCITRTDVELLFLQWLISLKEAEKVKVIIYGAGKNGKKLYRYAQDNQRCLVVGWVDKNHEEIGFPVGAPSSIKNIMFDYVVVSVENKEIQKEILKSLLDIGVLEEKIIFLM